ncbi:hypothetical protein OHR68_43200 [Spirillospora sp. NBC_00431]
MANLTVTAVPIDGGLADLDAAAVAAASGGDKAPVGPGRCLYLKNGDASTHTATLASPGTVKGLDVENPALVVAAGEYGLIPLPSMLAGADGRAAITYDAVTSVKVAVLELGT